MPYAINLYFNQEAENQVMDIWRSLDTLDQSKCLTCTNSRPHITLAIFNDLDLADAREKLASSFGEVGSFPLSFRQLGIFPHNKGTIFLTPNLSDELFQVHRRLHAIFNDIEDRGWDYYKPQSWYPHCTLAIETVREAIPGVLEEILKVFKPIDLRICSIGIASLDPISYLYEMDLK